jgi:hypothetical protein
VSTRKRFGLKTWWLEVDSSFAALETSTFSRDSGGEETTFGRELPHFQVELEIAGGPAEKVAPPEVISIAQ